MDGEAFGFVQAPHVGLARRNTVARRQGSRREDDASVRINDSILVCRHPLEVLRVCEQQLEELSFVNVTTALHRLAKMRGRLEYCPPPAALPLAQRAAALQAMVPGSRRARGLANALRASVLLATEGWLVPAPLSTADRSSACDADCQGPTNVAWRSVAPVPVEPPSTGVAEPYAATCPTSPVPQDLANGARLLTKLGSRGQAVLCSAQFRGRLQAAKPGPQNSTNIGRARAKPMTVDELSALEAEAVGAVRPTSPNQQNVANATQELAALLAAGAMPVRPVVRRAAGVSRELSPQGLSNIGQPHATLSTLMEPAVRAAWALSLERFQHSKPQEMSNLARLSASSPLSGLFPMAAA